MADAGSAHYLRLRQGVIVNAEIVNFAFENFIVVEIISGVIMQA